MCDETEWASFYRSGLGQALVCKTEIATTADNNVIQAPNPHYLAHFKEPFGDLHVLIARCGITRRVVVDEDKPSGHIGYGWPEHIPRMHQAGCHRANRASGHAHHAVFAVQMDHQEAPEFFTSQTHS